MRKKGEHYVNTTERNFGEQLMVASIRNLRTGPPKALIEDAVGVAALFVMIFLGLTLTGLY